MDARLKTSGMMKNKNNNLWTYTNWFAEQEFSKKLIICYSNIINNYQKI